MSGGIAEPLSRLAAFYETLGPQDVARLDALYAPDAYFKDPFNEVRGVAAIRRIFEHMFRQVDQPRFVVTGSIAEDDRAVLLWEFRFSFRRPLPAGPQVVLGCSHLRFDAAGRVCWHRDYWDTAEELYAKLPLLGGLMRLLRRRGAASG